ADVLVAITHAVPPYGVVGVNLYLADLLEDLLNYPNASPAAKQGFSYAFLLDRDTGNTLAHPAFPRPLIQREPAYPVNIAYLENATDFSSILRRMLQEERGNASTGVYLGRQQLLRTYHWQSVLGIYVLCLVSTASISGAAAHNASVPQQRYNRLDAVSSYESGYYGDSMDILYHRLDLLQNAATGAPANCRYFRQLATMDAPTLFLSAAAFNSPFAFLHNNRPRTQLRQVESIMAYLRDSRGLFANPGLRPRIRHEVLCQNRTLQRYYAFNTSLATILSNVVHGERTKYAIALIRGSNLFAAVLNSSCDGGAFCPCSTIDRVCLNCKRMDQTDCECPCECPMLANSDARDLDDYTNYTRQFPYCAPPSEHFLALPPTTQLLSMLPSCTAVGGGGSCETFATQRECLGIMGCEWCQQDVEGNTFATAFCSSQAGCFNGVLASLTPYGELDELEMLAAHNPQREQHAYSAFGPLGGAIVVLAIVIGFAIYCYRHNLDTQALEQFYVDSVQEENYGLPLSRFNFDDCQAHDEPPMGGYDHAAAQRQLMHAADISPYHMSSGSSYYRRPPNGESDHGYSTMTPHEDSSDQQCFTLAEPLLLHDKRHSKSDTMSISTSISSPTNRQQSNAHPYLSNQPASKTERYKQQPQATPSPCRGTTSVVYGQTTLPLDAEEPRSHYILAPVTVHRHMETAES
ncbi:hypothetical protein AWZ03_014877, partial [Drosophila navojoa]